MSSKGRQQILRFAKMIDVKVDRLTWTPISRGGEMQGPSGGWECEWSAEFDKAGTCYGLNADELCADLLRDFKHQSDDVREREWYRLGVVSAATEKDAEIADLKRRLASGDVAQSYQAINGYIAAAISGLLRAVHQSGWCRPPMRNEWIMQTLLDRHLGERWGDARLFVPPERLVEFKPLAEEERKQYEDGSPWQDLALIRKAAGTQDTAAIVRMIADYNASSSPTSPEATPSTPNTNTKG